MFQIKIVNKSGTTVKTYEENDIFKIYFSRSSMIGTGELQVDQFVAEVRDNIEANQWAQLYYRRPDQEIYLICLANFWITNVNRTKEGRSEITAKSALWFIEDIILPEKVYNNETVEYILANDIFLEANRKAERKLYSYNLSSRRISGYCPEQTARERLHWLCLIDNLSIYGYSSATPLQFAYNMPQDVYNSQNFISRKEIYVYPTIKEQVGKSAIKITSYTYTQGKPEAENKYVVYNGVTYIQTDKWHEITRQEANPNDPFLNCNNITLLSPTQAEDVGKRLTDIYCRPSVALNFSIYYQYKEQALVAPGDVIAIQPYMYDDTFFLGTVETINYEFGHNGLKLNISIPYAVRAEDRNIAIRKLTVRYIIKRSSLEEHEYFFLEGENYSIENPIIDKLINEHIYVFLPYSEKSEGTITGDTIMDTDYTIALDYEILTKTLEVLNADKIIEKDKVIEIG